MWNACHIFVDFLSYICGLHATFKCNFRHCTSPENLDFKGFFRPLKLFPLDRRRGFAGDVVADAVDAADFVDDADGDAVEHVVGDAGPVGGHEVAGIDGAQRQRVVVRPAVTHDADGAHGGQNSKIQNGRASCRERV